MTPTQGNRFAKSAAVIMNGRIQTALSVAGCLQIEDQVMRFLGRCFCVKTQTWIRPDGAGGIITEEDRIDLDQYFDMKTIGGGNALFVLSKVEQIKERAIKRGRPSFITNRS